MLEIFQFEFMRRAFLIGLVVAITAPTIGLFFVVRRYSAMADTLAHVSLAGVAASLFAGFAAIPTALLFSICSVLGIEHLREKKVLPPDTILSLFLFGSLALGVVLLGLSHGKNVNIVNYLFGNIITVTSTDLISIVTLGIITLVVTKLLWRQLFAVSIDEDIAEAVGLPVRTLNRILAVLGASTIAISMSVVGVLLIGALMVIPTLAAMQFRYGFKKTWQVSVGISLLSVILGLTSSYYLNLASGGTIVLFTVFFFLIATYFSNKTARTLYDPKTT